MAKIAKCGYGSHGQGVGHTDGYVYVVNDNVRTGDKIQVVSTSKRGRKFGTTAVPLHIHGENTVKGRQAVQQAEQATGEVTRAYSAKELGVSTSTRKPAEVPQALQDIKGITPQSPQTLSVRGGNLSQYMQTHQAELTPYAEKQVETYDSYSRQFMPKGGK